MASLPPRRVWCSTATDTVGHVRDRVVGPFRRDGRRFNRGRRFSAGGVSASLGLGSFGCFGSLTFGALRPWGRGGFGVHGLDQSGRFRSHLREPSAAWLDGCTGLPRPRPWFPRPARRATQHQAPCHALGSCRLATPRPPLCLVLSRHLDGKSFREDLAQVGKQALAQ